ncbi:MAG: hypothetical protein ACRD4L_14520 [Pyrinomonadaceae bacterium]
MGGTVCGFAGGFATGLGVGSFFGCVACGVAALVIGVGVVIAC